MGTKSSKSTPRLRLKLSVAQQLLNRDRIRTSKSPTVVIDNFDSNGELSASSLTPPETDRRNRSSPALLLANNTQEKTDNSTVKRIEVQRHKGKINLRSLVPRSVGQTEETVSCSPRQLESFSTLTRTRGGSSEKETSRRTSLLRREVVRKDVEPAVGSLFVERGGRGKDKVVTLKRTIHRRKVKENPACSPSSLSLLPYCTSPLSRRSGVHFASPSSTVTSTFSLLSQFLRRTEERNAGKTYVPRKSANSNGDSQILSHLLQMTKREGSDSRAEKKWRWKGVYGEAGKRHKK